MDSIHEEFEELLAQTETRPEKGWVERLTVIDAHLRRHFAEEDKWMIETDFPPRQCHMDEHAAVLKSSAEVLQLALDGDLGPASSFTAELARWFPGHADYLDSALAAWMCKRRFGGKPVVLRPGRGSSIRNSAR